MFIDREMDKEYAVKVLVAQSCLTLYNPMDCSQLSMEFFRQEYWSG